MSKSASHAVPTVAACAAEPEVLSDVSVPGSMPEKGLPLRLGVLTEQIPPALVDAAAADAGRIQRPARLLQGRAVVYFVLGFCLFSGADSAGPPGYGSVLRSLSRCVCCSLGSAGRWPRAGRRGVCIRPADHGLGRHRDRHSRRRRQRRGLRPGRARRSPQLRLLALIECGTHAVLDAAFDGFHAASEHVLAPRVLGGLRPGMLLLADRNFPGHELWGLAIATGADLAPEFRSWEAHGGVAQVKLLVDEPRRSRQQ